MRKTLFYFFIVVIALLCGITLFWPVYYQESPNTNAPETKYGAFLATQHAIYVNDFKSASEFAQTFADVSYETPRRTYYLAEFLNGKLPKDPENLAKADDATSRFIYDAHLAKNEKWDELYNRHKNDKSALYAPLKIWAGVARKRTTEILKHIDTLESNPSWKSFIRGQIFAETGDIKRAADEFAKVSYDFMNMNDYMYLMSFYQENNLADAAETLKKSFTSTPGGMFMLNY